MIGIYLIRNLTNGKCYIGQSIDIERRFREHKNRSVHTQYETNLYKAFKKYGLENFSFEILDICDKELLDEKEKCYILEYKTLTSENGYNQTNGGKGYSGKFEAEHIRKIAESKTKNKNPMYNKKPSEETLKKRSLALKGKKKPESFKLAMSRIHKGRILTQETKDKIRNKVLGFKHSEETKDKIRRASLGRKHSEDAKFKISQKVSKKIEMYDLQGNYIRTFDNARKATEETNVNYTNISACCNDKRKNAGGFIWKFENGGN